MLSRATTSSLWMFVLCTIFHLLHVEVTARPRLLGQTPRSHRRSDPRIFSPVRYQSSLQDPQLDASLLARSSPFDIFSLGELTCYFYEQPLNHFDLPRSKSGTFQQRYCVSNEFVSNSTTNDDTNGDSTTPIFFYTGNESPLEAYIQHTGLLWELAREFQAQVVFAEHRYEGKSIPLPHNMPSCMAYSSSVQAIADYARLIRNVLWRTDTTTMSKSNHAQPHRRPVICFGGSYGGMLSAWIRMQYPQGVTGSIAASAPIWGFPSEQPLRMDAAYAVVRHGLAQPYPPNQTSESHPQQHPRNKRNLNQETSSPNRCPNNLLASFPLIHILGQDRQGLDFLARVFRLCQDTTLSSVDDLLAWLQTPWFDLAEGSFPYPSSYIPFALTHLNVTLPAWPLQAACWKTGLVQDYGIEFHGSLTNVTYNISFAQSTQAANATADDRSFIQVDWDQATSTTSVQEWIGHPSVAKLLSSVRNAVSIWYNMTHNVSCYLLQAAPNHEEHVILPSSTTRALRSSSGNPVNSTQSLAETCLERIHTGSWESLCCNEDMNLIITYNQGIGQDVFWPPAVPQSVKTYADYVDHMGDNILDPFCDDPNGWFGYPSHSDPFSNFLDLTYGSYSVLETSSNILFSNGLLDPWSAAGVIVNEFRNDSAVSGSSTMHKVVPGLWLQKHKHGMASLLLEHGGHHVDLMFRNAQYDPPAFAAARTIERLYVASWIQEFWNSTN